MLDFLKPAADYVFTAGSLVFAASLVPALRQRAKPPYATSIPTGVLLLIFSALYVSLSLPLAAITSALTGTLWLALTFQRLLQGPSQPTANYGALPQKRGRRA